MTSAGACLFAAAAATAVSGSGGDLSIVPDAGPAVLALPAAARDTGPAGAPGGVLTPAQLALHREAAARLGVIVEETLAEARRALLAGEAVTEGSLVAFVEARFARDGLVSDRRPVLSTGANGSYPDHPGGTDQAIERGQVLLVDLMAKRDAPDAVHARVTWTAFAGRRKELPARVERVWKMVRDARESALDRLQSHVAKGTPLSGEALDLAARAVIRRARHGPWFLHAAGEPLGTQLRAAGARIAAGEERLLLPGTCYSLRPAVYYPGEFGVRSEIDVCLADGGVEVTTGVRQREIRPLLE